MYICIYSIMYIYILSRVFATHTHTLSKQTTDARALARTLAIVYFMALISIDDSGGGGTHTPHEHVKYNI